MPEKLAFLAYSRVKAGKSALCSKYSYFQSFLQRNLGLISLASHLYYTDTTGENYLLQLGYILQKVQPSTKIILLGYSFGGMQLFKILKANPHIQNNIHGLIFLDPVDKLESLITFCENAKLTALLCLSNDVANRAKVIEITESIAKSCQTKFLDCSHDELPSAALAKYVLPFIDKAI